KRRVSRRKSICYCLIETKILKGGGVTLEREAKHEERAQNLLHTSISIYVQKNALAEVGERSAPGNTQSRRADHINLWLGRRRVVSETNRGDRIRCQSGPRLQPCDGTIDEVLCARFRRSIPTQSYVCLD